MVSRPRVSTESHESYQPLFSRLAISNLVLVVLLSLKNTPLSVLTPWTYERLNFLHRKAGYVTMILVIIHASTYTAHFFESGDLTRLTMISDIYGMVAGVCFLVLVLAGAVIRRYSYELFYHLHITFWVLALVFTGLHQSKPEESIYKVTIIAGAIWGADRLIRLVRLVLNSVSNSAKLYPLANGGTRIVVQKGPAWLSVASGQHAFLWIPGIKTFEMHPFTIASVKHDTETCLRKANGAVEFVVASYDGFTKALHDYAVRHGPAASVRASVEGPYGKFTDTRNFGRVVFVAGGSGASFTVGRALGLVRGGYEKRVTFVWAVKHECKLSRAKVCWDSADWLV